MAIELQKDNTSRIVGVCLSGRLTRQDYKRFIPRMERLISNYGNLGLLVLMQDFHGWDFGGRWENTKFSFKHYGQIERIALVGETKWRKRHELVLQALYQGGNPLLRFRGSQRRSRMGAWRVAGSSMTITRFCRSAKLQLH